MLDNGSEADVSDPAATFGTSAAMCLALGVHTHGDGGRKAEGVCHMPRGSAKDWSVLLEPLLMMWTSGGHRNHTAKGLAESINSQGMNAAVNTP